MCRDDAGGIVRPKIHAQDVGSDQEREYADHDQRGLLEATRPDLFRMLLPAASELEYENSDKRHGRDAYKSAAIASFMRGTMLLPLPSDKRRRGWPAQ